MELSSVALGISPSMTLKIDALAKEMRSEGADVIGFGAGEPDFDTPRYIKDAAIAAINAGKTKYTPAAGLPELRQAICDRYERKYGLVYSPDQIAVASGAKHSLFNIFQVMLNQGEEVIIIAPYWLTYPEQVRMAEGVPVVVDTKFEDGFQPYRKCYYSEDARYNRKQSVKSHGLCVQQRGSRRNSSAGKEARFVYNF